MDVIRPVGQSGAVLGALVFLAGCAAGSPQADGTVTGTLEAVGGPVASPAPGTPRPLPGTITLRSPEGTTFTATATSDGTFSIGVPAGSYTATGRSPLYQSGAVDCQASGPLTVTAGATSWVDVTCQES